MLHLSRDELGVNMSLVNHWVFLEQVAEGMGRARGLALPVGGSVLGGLRKHLSLPGHCRGGGNCSRPAWGHGEERLQCLGHAGGP
jgi:hypothetical protein